MNFRAFVLCTTALLFSQFTTAGGTIDASLSNESVRLEFDAARRESNLHVSIGGLHHKDDGELGFIGLHVVDAGRQAKNLYIGIGGKIYGYSSDNLDDSGGALGVGAFARYALPGMKGFGVGGHVYYAPDVIAFGDTESLREVDVRLEYKVIDNARVYLGLRDVNVEVEGSSSSYTIDDGLKIGVRLDF